MAPLFPRSIPSTERRPRRRRLALLLTSAVLLVGLLGPGAVPTFARCC